jgi:hypothetical protein
LLSWPGAIPKRLIKYSRANVVNVYFADNSHNTAPMWSYFSQANQPLFERGVTTELLDDDGSPAFADLHKQAQQGPFLSRH